MIQYYKVLKIETNLPIYWKIEEGNPPRVQWLGQNSNDWYTFYHESSTVTGAISSVKRQFGLMLIFITEEEYEKEMMLMELIK